MTHLDPSILAQYNSLVDPHLQSYFSNERVRTHLKHAGLITGQGEIVPDAEYRTRLVRREHKKHVQHMLAENIVNRAIDMERARQSEMKRQFEMVAKAALVNNIKETRRRSGNYSGFTGTPTDMGLLSLDASWTQTRPRSANCYNETPREPIRIPRVESAHSSIAHRRKSSSKSHRHRRSRLRSKPRSSTNPRSSTKYPNLSSSSSLNPCEIRMVYYGPKIQVDYDHLVFEPVDEIMVMQQHCGGENIIVYKENLKSGAEFTFPSRRHSDYPFGLTLYVKGFIDSRISTCCEYKHRRGVRLGGDRGHFAIISVKGSKPCVKCRYEKQARLKKYAESPKDKGEENKKPITIPLPVSDEPRVEQPPIQIPVRHTSISHDHSTDGSDKEKHSDRNGHSTDASTQRKSKSKEPERRSAIARKPPQRKSSASSDDTPKEKFAKKTWEMIFHASSIPKGKDLSLKFSFLANNGKDQTETSEINIKQFNKHFKSDKQYVFSVKLKNIGQPEQIRLKMQTKDDDDDEEDEDIKFHLEQIELIDPETQSHSIFPCKQWIRLSQEKTLRISQATPRSERKRKTSLSSNDSRRLSPKIDRKPRISSASSTASIPLKQSSTKFTPARRASSDTDSNRTLRSTSEKNDDDNNQGNSVRYRVTIYPSKDDDGDFYPVRNSRIFLRLNNQRKETNLTDQTCPAFIAGEKQTFELDLVQKKEETPKKLTIGYVNSDITATKWKLDKIVLRNVQTDDETTFPCHDLLIRDDSNFRAEKTLEIQPDESDDESTPRNSKIVSAKSDQKNHLEKHKSPSSSDEEIQTKPLKKQETNGSQERKTPSIQSNSDREEQIQTPKRQITDRKTHQKNDDQKPPTTTNETMTRNSPPVRSTDDERKQQQTNETVKERSPSFQSMNDDEADYKKIFKKLDPKNDLHLGSPPSTPAIRPKTRRGPQDQSDEHYLKQSVEPLVGLDGLENQTARSNDQQTLSSFPSTTTDHTENHSRRQPSTNHQDD